MFLFWLCAYTASTQTSGFVLSGKIIGQNNGKITIREGIGDLNIKKADTALIIDGKFRINPKELLIVPGADHVDLYDRLDKIPFDKIAAFFTENLK